MLLASCDIVHAGQVAVHAARTMRRGTLGACLSVACTRRAGTGGALAAGASVLGRGGASKHEALLRKLRTLEASHKALVAGERCQVGRLQPT